MGDVAVVMREIRGMVEENGRATAGGKGGESLSLVDIVMAPLMGSVIRYFTIPLNDLS